MNMTDGVGRRYKYYKGAHTIFPFGYGLSYTTFTMELAESESAIGVGGGGEAETMDTSGLFSERAVKIGTSPRVSADHVLFSMVGEGWAC